MGRGRKAGVLPGDTYLSAAERTQARLSGEAAVAHMDTEENMAVPDSEKYSRNTILAAFRDIAQKASLRTYQPQPVTASHQDDSPANHPSPRSSDVAYGEPGGRPGVPLGPSPYVSNQVTQADAACTLDISGPQSPLQQGLARHAAMRVELQQMNQARASMSPVTNLPLGQGAAGAASRRVGDGSPVSASNQPNRQPAPAPGSPPGRDRGIAARMPHDS